MNLDFVLSVLSKDKNLQDRFAVGLIIVEFFRVDSLGLGYIV